MTVTLALLGALGTSTSAHAQRGDSLQVGVRYRVTLPKFADRPGPQFPQSRWLAGELVGRHGDTLEIRPHPTTGTVAVPIVAIDRLERSRGVSRAASAFEGAVGGALIGALFGNVAYGIDPGRSDFDSRWEATWTSAAFTAGAGLLAGLLFPAERWKRVDKPTP
jgi:hypothetical protein